MSATEKKRIIHLVNDLGIGGVQKVVLDICSSADLDKYDVSIYSLANKVDLLSTYHLDPRIRIRTFSYDFDPDFTFWAYLKRALRLPAISQDERVILDAVGEDLPDILHVHLVPRELHLGILIQQRTKCELLYTQHLTNLGKNSPGTILLGLIFRLTFRKYHLIAVSSTIQNEMLRHRLVGRNKKLFVIENRLNLRKFIPAAKIRKDYICVVYVARIGPPKAHDDLINAWSLLKKDPNAIRLILVGPDSLNNQMQMLAHKLGVEDSIEFTGPSLEIMRILNEADIAVFPSHVEGLPLALLEKMAMSLPVIVSDIPELTTIISDYQNGLVFRCGDVNDLAEKLTILIQDPELRKSLGRNARETIEERFGSTNIALPNELAYEEITSK